MSHQMQKISSGEQPSATGSALATWALPVHSSQQSQLLIDRGSSAGTPFLRSFQGESAGAAVAAGRLVADLLRAPPPDQGTREQRCPHSRIPADGSLLTLSLLLLPGTKASALVCS